MSNYLVSRYFYFFVFIFVNTSFISNQDLQFLRTEILSDMHVLEDALMRNHPNLYLYTTASEFLHATRKWQRELPDHLNGHEAYSAIARYSSIVKDRHTLFYPGKKIAQASGGSFFPFRIYVDQSKLHVQHNYSDILEISDGAEIISINGVSADVVLDHLNQRMMNDGNNYNYSHWVLNHFFSSYYAYCLGNPTEFILECKNQKDVKVSFVVSAKMHDEIADIRKRRYPDFTTIYQEGEGNGLTLQMNTVESQAVVRIRDFHKSLLKKTYQQSFNKSIEHFFTQIENEKIENLILDLRDNQGGNLSYSHLLLKYLLSEPFQMMESYAKVDKQKLMDSEKRLKKVRGEELGTFKPFPNAFKGKVIVLINGGSFSNTGIFSSTLKKYNRATFVGEETGGSEFLLSSDAKRITLPNTGIIVEVPTLQYQIKKVDEEELHGVHPDILIRPTIQDLIRNFDVVLERAKGMKVEL